MMDRLANSYDWFVERVRSVTASWKRDKSYAISISTGDKRGAGTDANIYLVLYDQLGNASKTLRPSHAFRDDHERGQVTCLRAGPGELGIEAPFTAVDIWRDAFGQFSLGARWNSLFLGGPARVSDDWFLDYIEVRHLDESPWTFPCHRWIENDVKFRFHLFDCSLPQNDSRQKFRRDELRKKKLDYVLQQKIPGGPVQIANLPSDENFSSKFFWTFVQKKACLLATTRYIKWTVGPWTSFDEFEEVFKLGLGLPKCAEYWKTDSWFGLQRVQGVDPTHIKLCTEIPSNFDLSSDTVQRVIGPNANLEDLMKNRKIFICDLAILDGLTCKDAKEIAAPIALFYLDQNDLLPLAIQLRQNGPNNPVYTPLDAANTWLVAKMYYNNSEAQYHQSLTHLAFTHLIMEGICACVHRCLSPSHPIFRLLAPHFLYLIAINKRGEEKLINKGGWVDSTMTQAVYGMMQLMKRGFEAWNFQKLNPKLELAARGVLDPEVLTHYPYRDDMLCVFPAIQTYVETIIRHYYADDQSLQDDTEIQTWRKELSAKPPHGLSIQKIPGDDILGFGKVCDLSEVIACIIATCSLGHSAANSQQYDQYAFIPNYPGILSRDPPKTKMDFSEADIIGLLPSKEISLDIMVITNLLSSPITNKLGDFEVKYLFDPLDVGAAQRLGQDLLEASEDIKRRNLSRKIPYKDLSVTHVPNSISI